MCRVDRFKHYGLQEVVSLLLLCLPHPSSPLVARLGSLRERCSLTFPTFAQSIRVLLCGCERSTRSADVRAGSNYKQWLARRRKTQSCLCATINFDVYKAGALP